MIRTCIARRVALVIGCAALAACDGAPPVVWGAVTRTPGASAPDWRLVLDSAARPAVERSPVVPIALPPGACAASLVTARLAGEEWFAAWWMPRPDGSAALVAARSVDGGRTWAPPVTADGRDRSVRGCDRPRPAIAADSVSGYVHLAYYLRAEDGAGVWFTHSMDHGAMWHAPVGLYYGDDPARTSVAAHGDTVVVAYEYPNAREGRVGIAISRTMGHIFEARLPASGPTERASDPRVAVRGGVVAVAWQSRPPGAERSDGPVETVIGVGRLR